MTTELLKSKALCSRHLFSKKEKTKPLSRAERLYIMVMLNYKKNKI